MRVKLNGIYLVMMLLLLAAAPAAARNKVHGLPMSKMAVERGAPGHAAPDFRLSDFNGNSRTLGEFSRAGNVVVLEWVDPTCDYVQRYHGKDNFVAESMDDFSGEPVTWFAIDSSNASADSLRAFHTTYGVPMPILMDTTGHVQRAFGVTTTPTMVVISRTGEIVYRGAPDSSSITDERTGGENYLKAAINAALDAKVPAVTETAVDGCPI